MKKIFASVGLVAVGATAAHAAYAPGLSTIETSKPWAISASLRGFYDDNFTTVPKTALGVKRTFGFEVSPSVSVNHAGEQTLLSASYVYDFRWYAKTDTKDQSHQFNAKVDHAFSERYKVDVNDSFVIAQEPQVIDPTLSSPVRTPGGNIRNTGGINFTADVTEKVGVLVGYANSIYDYKQNAGDIGSAYLIGPGGTPFLGGSASRAGLLDRMEHRIPVDLLWHAMPNTVAHLGYIFGAVQYTSPEAIMLAPVGPSPFIFANARNNRSHTVDVGVDQTFNTQLSGSLRVGAQYFDYYNDPSSRSEYSPYADASLVYRYAQKSYAQVGVRHSHNATDVPGSPTAVVNDQESTLAYLNLTHQITGALAGSFLGSYQHSSFTGISAGEDFFSAGLNFAYQFNPHILAEAGYNFDDLASDLPNRGYSRNRVYLGVRAAY